MANHRKKSNVGTGICWSYNSDPYWVKNSKTGGWFYDPHLKYSQPVESYERNDTASAPPDCAYLDEQTVCNLWNSGHYRHACNVNSCSYRRMLYYSVSFRSCKDCIKRKDSACTEPGCLALNEVDQATYCCFFEPRQKPRSQQPPKPAPIAKAPVGPKIPEPPTIRVLNLKPKICPFDSGVLRYIPITFKNRNMRQDGTYNILHCEECGRLFLPSNIKFPSYKYVVNIVTDLPSPMQTISSDNKKAVTCTDTHISPPIRKHNSVPTVEVGQRIHSVQDGTGEVISVSTVRNIQQITVRFKDGIKSFDSCLAFSRGTLTLIDK